MKGSLIVVAVFAAGLALGYSGVFGDGGDFSQYSMWVLYLLLAIIGFEFGHKSLIPTVKSLTVRSFLLPLFTIGGTLLFSAVAWLLLRGYSLSDYLAMASGFGYYSLAPLLIMEHKGGAGAAEAAAEIATIALMANMVREILSLTCAPFFKRVFGWYAPIAASGVASIDVVLPVIIRTCGQEAVAVAIVQGVVLEMCVPILVILFCSLG